MRALTKVSYWVVFRHSSFVIPANAGMKKYLTDTLLAFDKLSLSVCVHQ